MNKATLTGVVLGAALATAGGVFAGYKLLDDDDAKAAPLALAAERCTEEAVTRPVDPKDEHRIAGTVLGALVGGAVGKDVGDRDITTAAGAAAGALAGNQVQKKLQNRKTYTTMETHCAPAQR